MTGAPRATGKVIRARFHPIELTLTCLAGFVREWVEGKITRKQMNYLIESNIALCVIGGLFLSLALYSLVNSIERIWPDADDASVFTTPSVDSANWHEPMFHVVESVEELEARVGVTA